MKKSEIRAMIKEELLKEGSAILGRDLAEKVDAELLIAIADSAFTSSPMSGQPTLESILEKLVKDVVMKEYKSAKQQGNLEQWEKDDLDTVKNIKKLKIAIKR